MRIEVLLAILPAVLAAENASSDAAQPSESCNLHCSLVVEAQSKFCPNDTTGSCLCSLSVDDFWKHYAECNCTNPEGLEAEAAKSKECATVQAGSQAEAAATSAPEASSEAAAPVAIESVATDAASEVAAEASSAQAEGVASSVAATVPSEAVAEAAASSPAGEGECNMHCKEVDAIEKQMCADSDLNCLCQLSTEQYWEHVHDCNCINDKNLSIEEIKAQVCNSTDATDATDAAAAASSSSSPAADEGTPAVAGGDIPTLATIPEDSSYGGDSNSTGFVPQVALQNENLGSKNAILSIGAVAVIMANFL